jgi:hypothetical protein
MSLSYQTYDVSYEHTTESSDMVRQNRAVVTVYGGGEFKLKAEIERQRPDHRNVNILGVIARSG